MSYFARAPRITVGRENRSPSCLPAGVERVVYLGVGQLLPARRQVEGDAVHVAGQGGGTHQQTHQDQVRKRGREVHRLSDRHDRFWSDRSSQTYQDQSQEHCSSESAG